MTHFYDASSMEREIVYVFGDETRAAVRFNVTAKTVWGESYYNEYLAAIECRDGKIVAIDELFDTKFLFDTVDTSKVDTSKVDISTSG